MITESLVQRLNEEKKNALKVMQDERCAALNEAKPKIEAAINKTICETKHLIDIRVITSRKNGRYVNVTIKEKFFDVNKLAFDSNITFEAEIGCTEAMVYEYLESLGFKEKDNLSARFNSGFCFVVPGKN